MSSTELAQAHPRYFGSVPIPKWLVYSYVVVNPFFVFSILFSRDFASFWIIVTLFLFVFVETIRKGGKVLFDRTVFYLFLMFAAYAIGTIVILFQEPSFTWAGRTPLDRAIGIDIRLGYVLLAYYVFVYVLCEGDETVFRRLLQIQFIVGVLIGLFGILQFISYLVFGSTALIGIESTNEAFQTRGNFSMIGGERVFRSSSIFSEPSYFGFYLVPLLVKSVLSWVRGYVVFSRPIDLFILGTLSIALAANFSLTAFLSLALVLVIYAARNLNQNPATAIWTVTIGALMGIFVLLSPFGDAVVTRLVKVFELGDLSAIDRLVRAYSGLIVFLEHPLFGVGPGGFAFFYPKIGFLIDHKLMHSPLNIWFTILTDVGVVGIVPFMLFLGRVFNKGRHMLGKTWVAEVYFWSILSYLVLLTTVDFWFLDIFWFELAVLTSISFAFQKGNNLNPHST